MSKLIAGPLKVETVFTLAAACWALFLYFSHDREAKELGLQQQRLATEQAAAVAKTHVATESARLEQFRLSNSQAALALAFQSKTQSIAFDQQRLATDQSRLSLAIAESQRKLRDLELRQSVRLQEQEIALKALQAKKAQHEVEYLGKYRFGQKFELTGKKVGGDEKNGAYELSHRFEFENKSETPFELSLYVIDYYIGVPTRDAAGQQSVSPLGEPANRWNPRGAKPGALEWTQVGHSGAIHAASVGSIPKPWCDAADVQHLVRGGPGTGSLKPAQSIQYGDTYLVRAPKHSYVAFVASFCFNRCETDDDLQWKTELLGVDEIDAQQSIK